jgi:hypothetical protein
MTPALVLIAGLAAAAVPPGTGYEVARATAAPAALLAADEPAWAGARAIEWGPAAYATRFRAAWSDEGSSCASTRPTPRPGTR